MKVSFLVLMFFIGVSCYAQYPKGLPSPSSNGWSKVGYLQAATTVTWTPVAGSSQYTWTPAQTSTVNMGTVPAAMVGQVVYLEVNTSGTTSFTLTFGTNIKTATSTLATGTVTAKLFVIAYLIQSTTNVVELYRTVAQ